MRAVVLATVVMLAGCGVAERRSDDVTATKTRTAGSLFAHQCANAAASASVAVLCPTRLPLGGFESPRNYGDAPCSYLINLEPRGMLERAGAVFHLLFGGTCEPWDLQTNNGRWPAVLTAVPAGADLRLIGTARLTPAHTEADRKRLGLRVLRRTRIGSAPALVLRNPPYPVGGIHGDHISIVWNTGGAGYAVSGHAVASARRTDDNPDSRAITRATGTLIATARSLRQAPRTHQPGE